MALILPRRRALIGAASGLVAGGAGPLQKQAVVGNANYNLTQGLVSYWKFDEGSGTIARNSVAQNINLTFSDSPTWTSGRFGSAILLNGSTDYFYLPLNLPFLDSVSSSICFWAVANATNAPILSTSRTTSGYTSNFGLNVYIDTSGFIVGGFYNDYFSETYNPPIGSWFHVVVIANLSQSTYSLFANGNFVTSAQFPSSNELNSPLYWIFGYAHQTYPWPNITNSYFSGKLDEIRFYNRALSAAEVVQLYRLYPDEGQ